MTSITFFLIFIPILALILLSINFIFAPHSPYQEKGSTFECGFHSFLGQNRTQFSISFFIFALLFLLFDLEILLVYPYVVSAYLNNIYGLVIMLIFFLILTLGFAFELGKNALKIDSKQISNYYLLQSSVLDLLALQSELLNLVNYILPSVNSEILIPFSDKLSNLMNSIHDFSNYIYEDEISKFLNRYFSNLDINSYLKAYEALTNMLNKSSTALLYNITHPYIDSISYIDNITRIGLLSAVGGTLQVYFTNNNFNYIKDEPDNGIIQLLDETNEDTLFRLIPNQQDREFFLELISFIRSRNVHSYIVSRFSHMNPHNIDHIDVLLSLREYFERFIILYQNQILNTNFTLYNPEYQDIILINRTIVNLLNSSNFPCESLEDFIFFLNIFMTYNISYCDSIESTRPHIGLYGEYVIRHRVWWQLRSIFVNNYSRYHFMTNLLGYLPPFNLILRNAHNLALLHADLYALNMGRENPLRLFGFRQWIRYILYDIYIYRSNIFNLTYQILSFCLFIYMFINIKIVITFLFYNIICLYLICLGFFDLNIFM